MTMTMLLLLMLPLMLLLPESALKTHKVIPFDDINLVGNNNDDTTTAIATATASTTAPSTATATTTAITTAIAIATATTNGRIIIFITMKNNIFLSIVHLTITLNFFIILQFLSHQTVYLNSVRKLDFFLYAPR